jgi:hypothetical protein
MFRSEEVADVNVDRAQSHQDSVASMLYEDTPLVKNVALHASYVKLYDLRQISKTGSY